MTKADLLGAGAAFGAARGARSSRRTAIDKTIGGEQADTSALTELAVTLISENPDNPRNHLRNLEETTESVREVGIILPIVVATVDAYLRDRPDRADDLDDGAQYVVIDGHRRLEAARRVGLAVIPVRVDNARVATDEALLEAAFVANYHRDDMTDLEEAHALKQLVDYYGSQTKAAKRLGIPQGTLSSKLSLLKLTPELQKDLVTGARKVEHVRNLGKLSAEEQREKADERAQAAQRRAQAAPPVGERVSGAADYHGVIIPGAGAPAGAPPEPDRSTAANQRTVTPSDGRSSPAERRPTADSIPEPRTDGAAPPSGDEEQARAPKPFPYDDPGTAVLLCHQKMSHDAFVAGGKMWMKVMREEYPDDYRRMINETAEL